LRLGQGLGGGTGRVGLGGHDPADQQRGGHSQPGGPQVGGGSRSNLFLVHNPIRVSPLRLPPTGL